ncbi:putative phage protein gp47/JayE [Anaerobacterium chartisolvens]|uniref:Putative phage protein gp47/JayE n=1 Tax=Anaerobacterium chartisolvens TaxID=1297424 RepID=A0A369AV64_9FIRM|nr:baseplate J/gp47 family protein [Anaerobacterium chartisolvens]RCX13270.1 putative phage protein gp47/JayE [Anaerobacterium chartisolvens]
MYENETEQAIKNRMLANAPEGINTAEGDFFNDAVSPAALELTLAYQQLDRLLGLGFAESAYGEYLDKITSERGIGRKPATKGTGTIEVTAAVGSVINTGDILATWQGNIRFASAETKTVGQTGKVLIRFENETAGNMGGIAPLTQFIAPVAIPGFISARSTEYINAGADEESDESLRLRYFSKVQAPVTSGNKYHYKNWAEEFPGVGAAKVFPLWNGAGTVKVVIIDSNKQPASEELVADVQQYIDPGSGGCGEGQAPIGAYCTVAPAEAVEINVTAEVSGADASEVAPLFERALAAYLADIAFTGAPVSYARIGTILLESISQTGGSDYTGLTVNGDSGNIIPGPEQVAVVGTVSLS